MSGDIGIFFAVEFRAIDAEAVQDLGHESARIVLPLAVAQRFFPAKIITHAEQPVVVAVVAQSRFAGQRESVDGRLVFDFTFGQIVMESRGEGRADAQIINRIIIGGNAPDEPCGIGVMKGAEYW